MEMVLGLSRSEIDIEEIRKRICYILLAWKWCLDYRGQRLILRRYGKGSAISCWRYCLSLVLPLRRKDLRM